MLRDDRDRMVRGQRRRHRRVAQIVPTGLDADLGSEGSKRPVDPARVKCGVHRGREIAYLVGPGMPGREPFLELAEPVRAERGDDRVREVVRRDLAVFGS